ncbi:hypothetical protein [Aquitalea denitrificans]|uniref:hypothetical protein n=1 Tax=Aquitalea denitrificans TaxID=519081 RepID=UPI001358476D|nr:hypothetical protein [Aquitalea denitrificans]
MTPADFEESEYRGPLYNQLERGNHLVWEPGQVFEKHIGIDRAAYVTDPYFWDLHDLSAPMSGVILRDYDWHYIWEKRLKNKILPDFKLNLFLQAKRPHAGTRPRGKVKKAGIVGDYWKFEITRHQQVALEQMEKTLNGNAIVCYAAPAFHTQAALYEHTKNQSIVPSSSFPPASALTGHGAWYYDNGGLSGVANPDFVRVEFEPLQTRIVSLMERTRPRSVNARESLHDLASALIRSTSEIQEPASTDTWFQQLLNRVDAHISSMTELGFRDEEYIQALRNYMQVRAFCNAYRLDWLVIGKGA